LYQPCINGLVHLRRPMYQGYTPDVPNGWYMVGTCQAICPNHRPRGWYMSHYMYQPCANPLVNLRRPMYQGYTPHVPMGWYMVGTYGATCSPQQKHHTINLIIIIIIIIIIILRTWAGFLFWSRTHQYGFVVVNHGNGHFQASSQCWQCCSTISCSIHLG
jgi:hypothetical protein